MVKSTISRRQFFTAGRQSNLNSGGLHPEWPNRRIARLHKKQFQDYWPKAAAPLSDSAPEFPVHPVNYTRTRDITWDMDTAIHLLNRTMTGATYEDINTSLTLDMGNSVQTLLEDLDPPEPPGDWVYEIVPDWNSLTTQEANDIIASYYNHMNSFRIWWCERMMFNPMNITEIMTLFWHNYFASAYSKVFYPQAMYQQNHIFRTYCLGNFKDLLRRITFGPAMMIWLDISGSRKQAPNENFARELMELFTLGVDNYSQEDVVAASRAFTGYVTDGVQTNYDFNAMEGWGYWWTDWHDFDEKTFLGQTGSWTGDDIINIILDQDECAVQICRQIYKWFVYDHVHEPFLDEMADILRSNNYEIKPLMEFLLTSDHFFDPVFRAANIQNPNTLVLGSIRRLGMENQNYPNQFFRLVQYYLGMIMFEPPDVSGWLGYRSWINSNTLPMRKVALCSLITGESPFGNYGSYIDVRAIAQSLYNPDAAELACEQVVQKLALLFFSTPLTESLEERMLSILLDGAEPYDWNINLPAWNAQWNRMKDLLQYMMRIPEFQLS